MKDTFYESIRVKDGEVHNIQFHNDRVNATRKEIFGSKDELILENYIKIPDNKFYKCRVEYSETVLSVELTEYDVGNRKKFKIIEVDPTIDYSFKTIHREFIDTALANKGDCDDIIMLRDGLLTDSSVANIACYIDGEWITPSTPISKGTTRQRLLQEGKIIEGEIGLEDVNKIERFAITNALFGFLEIEGFEIIL